MESFFFLQNGPEEQHAQSILYQWMRITYQDLIALTLENSGIVSLDSSFSQHAFCVINHGFTDICFE